MSSPEMPKELLTLWKQSWETYVKTLESMQAQGDKMMEMMLEQNAFLPDESKKAMEEWAVSAKKMQKAYLDMVQDNIKRMEELLGKK